MTYVLAALIALACMLGGRWLFKKWTILDKPKQDQKQARKPVPTILGTFVLLSFVIVVAVLYPEYLHNPIVWGLLVAGIIIGVPAFLDELNYLGRSKLNFPPFVRLITQVVAAVAAVWISGIGMEEFSFLGMVWEIPQWLFYIIFALWALICINAINRFDYANGQSSGVAGI